MSNKLFIGGLSWDTDDAGLLEAFQPFGDVREAKVITDRDTGRSRGFGFVTYSTGEQAQAAKDAMNGAILDGRTLRVDEAQDKGRGGGGGRRGGGGGRGGYGGGGRGGY
jgi:RNA recognition motif-containing protein